MKIINTDSYGKDYPDESFLGWIDSKGIWRPLIGNKDHLEEIVLLLNSQYVNNPRFYKVVSDDYKLQEGFEP